MRTKPIPRLTGGRHNQRPGFDAPAGSPDSPSPSGLRRWGVFHRLSLAFTTAVTLPIAAIATAQQLFWDDFNATTLDPRWTVTSPNPASSNWLDGSAFTLVAAWANGGSDLWNGTNHGAPRALQEVDPSLDWIIETRLDFSPTRDYQDAGLLLAKTTAASTDDGDYWRIAMRSFYPGGGGQVIRAVGSYTGYTGTSSYLRIEKAGPVYTGWWSSDGVTWIRSGSVTNSQAWHYAGIIAIRQPWDGAQVDSTAAFDYFHAASFPPAPPTITSPTSAGAKTGWYFAYQIVATANPISYDAIGLPAGLSIDPASGLISGTTASAGTYDVRLEATNYVGAGATNLTLSVSLNAPLAWPAAQGGNDHWYQAMLVGPPGINWTDASTAANSQGGYLATISGAAENAFAYDLVNDTLFWFIDAYGNGLGPWLGGLQPPGSPEPAGNWQWVSGEPAAYLNWDGGQPDDFQGNEDRIHFFGTGMLQSPQWNDVGASTLLRGFVIEYTQLPGPPSLSITRSNQAVIVSWPAPAEGWLLHATTSLLAAGSEWTEIPPPYEISGTSLQFTESALAGSRFYRLHRP